MAIPFDVWSPKFRSALGQFRATRDEVIERAAKYGENRAKGYAPVKSGALKASIEGKTEGTGTGARIGRQRLFLTAPRRYAPIEFGSRRGHRAQRFMERGMEDAIEYLRKEMEKDVTKLLIKGRIGHIGPRFSRRRIG